jgi:hypothetical protein
MEFFLAGERAEGVAVEGPAYGSVVAEQVPGSISSDFMIFQVSAALPDSNAWTDPGKS